MTVVRSRVVLIAVFALCLVVQVIVVMLAYSKGAIASGDLISLLTKLLAIYGVHFAVIIGGILAQHQNAQPAQVSAIAFWLAVALSLIWNLLLVWRSVIFGMAAYDVNIEDSVTRLLSYLDSISSAGSWLVAGALAFFFTKRS
jgi:hypothetical protein